MECRLARGDECLRYATGTWIKRWPVALETRPPTEPSFCGSTQPRYGGLARSSSLAHRRMPPGRPFGCLLGEPSFCEGRHAMPPATCCEANYYACAIRQYGDKYISCMFKYQNVRFRAIQRRYGGPAFDSRKAG